MDFLTAEWLVFTAVAAALAVFVLRLIFRAARSKLVRCPATGGTALVGTLRTSSGEPIEVIHDCSLWPDKAGCGQGCLERATEQGEGVPVSMVPFRPFEKQEKR